MRGAKRKCEGYTKNKHAQQQEPPCTAHARQSNGPRLAHMHLDAVRNIQEGCICVQRKYNPNPFKGDLSDKTEGVQMREYRFETH